VNDRMRKPVFMTWRPATAGAVLDFVSRLRSRYSRPARFVAIDFVFRVDRPSFVLERLLRRIHIHVAPRLQMFSRIDRPLCLASHHTESRVLLREIVRVAIPPVLERVRQRVHKIRTAEQIVVRSQERSLVRNSVVSAGGREHESAAITYRRAAVIAPPVEMVLRRQAPSPVQRRETEMPVVPTRSGAVIEWSPEERSAHTPGAAEVDIRHLTERVIDAMDRRAIASRERVTRR
jgi:hypothetical protein